MTSDAVKNMIRPWLTGNDERDAKSLRRTFRMIGLSISEWREIIKETNSAK
jgi:hypothetical protein